jgi:hypothetical protein
MAPVTVTAIRMISHPPERVYAFVADIENHWRLSDRCLRLEGLNRKPSGGRIIIAGPLGVRRTVHTTVTTEHEPHRFGGVATIGHRTRAVAHWDIELTQQGTRVVLESRACSLGTLDRILLALGGRWWLRREYRRVLARLAEILDVTEPTGPEGAT